MASTSPRRSTGGDPSSPSSPLLPSPASLSSGGGGGPLGRLTSLRGAARFIRSTGSRRLMREPSVAVWETGEEAESRSQRTNILPQS
ncbi:putative RING zinc finger domain superfamily protein [Panicum miliaceum]|uniref:RING zinc finger domain superfamily protein n=1 Tax=Panicum miliaceum TaxID=4540 RepID=A0A3L6T7J1_PANMI|nr:putative RING zinc finger domain superfamily protein [Panicum miliaceum]